MKENTPCAHAPDCASCAFRGKLHVSDRRTEVMGARGLIKSNDDWSEDHGSGPGGTMIRSKARRRLSNIHSKLCMPDKTCVRMWNGGSGQWDHGSIYEKASTSEACSAPGTTLVSRITTLPDPDLGLFVSSLSRRDLFRQHRSLQVTTKRPGVTSCLVQGWQVTVQG